MHLRGSSLSSPDPSTRTFSKSCINPSDAGVYNSSMSAVRTAVEWQFGDVINYFKCLDFKILT